VRSLDNGNTWTIEVIIASECYESGWYEIGVNGSFVHVSFPSSDFKVSYVRSEDSGTTWGTPVKLVSSNSFVARVVMAVKDSNIHIAWMDSKRAGLNSFGSRVYDIFYIKSEDNGLTWANDKNISKTPLNRSNRPNIDVSGENIYIVHTQDDGIYQAYLCFSRDNGNNWVDNIKLTNSTKHVYLPTISVKNETAFIVWVDSRDGSGEIYYKSSHDYGVTWSDSNRLTYRGRCNNPDIFVVDDWVHLVWDRGSKSNEDEIFYKRCEVTQEPIKALIDIDPNTLNLKSRGRWITAYIEMNEDYDINYINISTILLENSIHVESHPTKIGDIDNDGVPDLMVKFNRRSILNILTKNKSIILRVSGMFLNGTLFQGEDTIRVI
jgi:hypothetical protein